MSRLAGIVRNPVLGKEVKLRFRSFKSFLGIFFYLFVLTALALASLFLMSSQMTIGADQSRTLFLVLTIGQIALIAFMAPGLTAGVISGERERQTLNILLTTRQTSAAIILSKLFSSLAFLLLMVVSSLPLYAIAFLYGGISPQMVLATFGTFLLSMFTFGSIGVMFSTLIRKTIVAMITTYGVVLFMIAGTAVLTAFTEMYLERTGGMSVSSPHLFLFAVFSSNPVFILISFLENGFAQSLHLTSSMFQPPWLFFIECYLAVSLVTIWIAIACLRPRLKARTTKKEIENE